jgi:aldose 1-epimerase
MAVVVEKFGEHEGRRVDRFRLESTSGTAVEIITFGVSVARWQVPVEGGLRDTVLGFGDFAAYPAHRAHFGAIAGRVANRISGALFVLDGVTYALPANNRSNCLHGGPQGLGVQVWEAEPDSAGNAVAFTHVSPDGAMGFPGTVRFSVRYRLQGFTLSLDICAEADRRTPVSLAQHLYFNLGTGPDVLDHRYRLAASAYTPNREDLTPTGEILPVEGTRWDFRAGRTLRDGAGRPVGYDGNLVLDSERAFATPVAEVTAPDGALRLLLRTDRPGLQLYNAPAANIAAPGHGGVQYGPFSGFCLEDQALPDALANPYFPSIVYGPDRPYRHRTAIEIAPA